MKSKRNSLLSESDRSVFPLGFGTSIFKECPLGRKSKLLEMPAREGQLLKF